MMTQMTSLIAALAVWGSASLAITDDNFIIDALTRGAETQTALEAGEIQVADLNRTFAGVELPTGDPLLDDIVVVLNTHWSVIGATIK